MTALSLCPQFETNLTSNWKVIEVLLSLKIPRTHGKNYVKVVQFIVRYLLRNGLLQNILCSFSLNDGKN